MNLEPNNPSLSFAEFLDAATRDKAEAKPFPYTLEVCRCRYCSFCQNGKQGCELQLEELHKQVENAKAEIAKPFAREAELEEKCKRLAELNAELNMDKRENEIVDGAEEQSEDERDENSRTRSDRTDR